MKIYPEIKCLTRNPAQAGLWREVRDIVYSTATGEDLKLDLLLPWSLDDPAIPKEKLPALVFVQGSAWTTPNRGKEIPQLSMLARRGYIVATVGHRDATKGHPFPCYLQDVKCAIRFLRAHADEYNIDGERVAIWGTSSGGNTALLAALTADDPRYETEEYAGFSDAVKAAVSCFGPTDLFDIAGRNRQNPDFDLLMGYMFGTDPAKWEMGMREMSPLYHVEEGKVYPPFLLFHGTADSVVDYSEMVSFYHRLLDSGADVAAYQIENGVHEGNFWNLEIFDIVREFLDRTV